MIFGFDKRLEFVTANFANHTEKFTYLCILIGSVFRTRVGSEIRVLHIDYSLDIVRWFGTGVYHIIDVWLVSGIWVVIVGRLSDIT